MFKVIYIITCQLSSVILATSLTVLRHFLGLTLISHKLSLVTIIKQSGSICSVCRRLSVQWRWPNSTRMWTNLRLEKRQDSFKCKNHSKCTSYSSKTKPNSMSSVSRSQFMECKSLHWNLTKHKCCRGSQRWTLYNNNDSRLPQYKIVCLGKTMVKIDWSTQMMTLYELWANCQN